MTQLIWLITIDESSDWGKIGDYVLIVSLVIPWLNPYGGENYA